MNPLEKVAAELNLSAAEREANAALMERAAELARGPGIPLDDQARLGLAAHLASLMRRLKAQEPVQGIDPAVFGEVPVDCMEIAGLLISPLYHRVNQPVDPAEIGLVAIHFGAARERASQSS